MTAAIEKARRLLADGSVHILFASEGVVSARVLGESGIYDVSWDRNTGRWHCTCAALGDCSHGTAVWLVTMRPTGG
jgi:uncharacterized Zn finger protein